MVLVKSDIMIESIKPYLQALQNIEPLDVPFGPYLQLAARLGDVKIDHPSYSRLPGFRWELKHLLKADDDSQLTTTFDPNDLHQVDDARSLLEGQSLLDVSQANAIVDMLTQEVALVQGWVYIPCIHSCLRCGSLTFRISVIDPPARASLTRASS